MVWCQRRCALYRDEGENSRRLVSNEDVALLVRDHATKQKRHVVYPGQLHSEGQFYNHLWYYYMYYSSCDHIVMIPSTQVTPVQCHGSSCGSFSVPALSTVSINIEGYSQAKAEIVSTFAHGNDIVCMPEAHIGSEHCRPSIHGLKLIAETSHRKYGSAVNAKPILNIKEVHTEVTDSQIELITVSLAKITITSVYKPPAS